MNFVYKKDSVAPLSPRQLLDAVNEVCPIPVYSEADFDGPNDRVQKIICKCNGNGEFELVPAKVNEFRRFVRCRVCGSTLPL